MGQSENGKEPLSLVMITSDGPEHHYVANRFLEEFDLTAIIVDRGKPQTRSQRVRQLRDRYGFLRLLSRLLLRVTAKIFRDDARRREGLLDVFGPTATDFTRPDLVRYVNGINTDAGRTAVQDASPDLILVYGTGIVGGRVLGMARQGALNLHTGMSPEYRGSDCVFWPIHNRDFHLIGATVHECTARVDGGEIYGRAHAPIRSGDGPSQIFARCVEAGTDLYVDAIRRACDGRLTGVEQDLTVGKEYRAADMRLRYDLYVRWLFKSGKVREPSPPASVDR